MLKHPVVLCMSKKDSVRKLEVGYNHAFRKIMKSIELVVRLFVSNNVMSFTEIWWKVCTILDNKE